jgi:hypothetical protein
MHPQSTLGALLGAVLAFGGLLGCGGAGSTSGSLHDAGGDGTTSDDGGVVILDGSFVGDADLSPDVFGPGPGTGMCLQLGASCKTNGDCCSADCVGGFCNYPQCRSDNTACMSNGQCCSQTCNAGKCTPLSTTCSTLGNQCASSGTCCSGLCSTSTCQPSSFCTQANDACAVNGDCCTGVCNVASGKTLGTCAATPPGGPANCGTVDGQLCGGAGADGGAVFLDSGLPQCGGACCSRSCAPWGPTGVLVCQPASGCHPVGDLCTADADCCGASGILGGSNKPVTCNMSSGGPVGICELPMGCKPNGDVCKLATMSCNSSCDCCAGNCETQDTCKQDNVGVPRCADAQCQSSGSSCASSADCCNGNPCVPNPSGNPPYVCSALVCIPSCGVCTNNADCCPGTSCEVAQGSAHGICGPCGGGTTDGGTSGGGDGGGSGSSDGGIPTTDAGCGLYGQVCVTASQCCYGLPCTNGRCEQPIQ